MDWIYLSPHLDDAALSCGGLIWEQTQQGNKVSIWTIFAGDPPPGTLSDFALELHKRWGVNLNAISIRRNEDDLSCQLMGATRWHIQNPDCIYRTNSDNSNHLYSNEAEIFGKLHPGDQSLIESLRSLLLQNLPKNVNIVCPLTIGGHVDHILTRKVAEQFGRTLWYYADFPYVINTESAFARHRILYRSHQISRIGTKVWLSAIEAYESQLSTFWKSRQAMQNAVLDYLKKMGGIWLGRKSWV